MVGWSTKLLLIYMASYYELTCQSSSDKLKFETMKTCFTKLLCYYVKESQNIFCVDFWNSITDLFDIPSLTLQYQKATALIT
jgi:hypothetical protein